MTIRKVALWGMFVALAAACAESASSGPDEDASTGVRDSGTHSEAGEDASEDEDASEEEDDGGEVDASIPKDASVKDSGKDVTTPKDSGGDTSVADSGVDTDAGPRSDAGPVAAGAVVINEIDYDQALSDTNEFIEIFNPSATQTVDISGLDVVFVNGTPSTSPPIYRRERLTGTLGPLGYLVIGSGTSATLAATAGARVVAFMNPATTSDTIQNGAPDAVAIVDTSTNQVVDALSYEGSVTTPYNFVEGTATPAGDVGADGGAASFEVSLIRDPNGTDTNNAAADWKATRTITPGAPNVLTP